MTQERPVQVVAGPDELADAAAAHFATAAQAAVGAHGSFTVALSGGETPRGMYRRLAREPFRSGVPWRSVRVLWGDERCVPPDHAESNYRMAREALLDHVPVAPGTVHRIRGEENPASAAAQYEATIRALLRTPAGPPRTTAGARIDLVLLGLGAEGHTASLFPGSDAMGEEIRWVAAEYAAGPGMWRITLTPPVLNAAAEVLFLVSGPAKAGILRRVLEGPRHVQELPAQVIAPTRGSVRWLVDRAAAAELGKERE